MPRNKTAGITYGALMCALLGAVLFFNRQLAGMLDLYLFWFVPILVIIYSLKFSLNQAVVVAVAMIMLSFVVATPATVFYVGASVTAGLIYSLGLKRKWNALALMAGVFAVSILVAIVTIFLFSGIFGYNIVEELSLLKEMLAGSLPEGMMPDFMISEKFLLMLYCLFTVFSSIMEAVLVHLLAYLVLKRLKMELPPMKPVGEIMAPLPIKIFVFAAYFALIAAIITKFDQYQEVLALAGSLATIFVFAFGYLLMVTVTAIVVPDRRRRMLVLMALVAISIIFTPLFMGMGLLDIFTDVRRRMLKGVRESEKKDG